MHTVALFLFLGKCVWTNRNTNLSTWKEILEKKRKKGPIDDNSIFPRPGNSFSSKRREEDNILLVQSILATNPWGIIFLGFGAIEILLSWHLFDVVTENVPAFSLQTHLLWENALIHLINNIYLPPAWITKPRKLKDKVNFLSCSYIQCCCITGVLWSNHKGHFSFSSAFHLPKLVNFFNVI